MALGAFPGHGHIWNHHISGNAKIGCETRYLWCVLVRRLHSRKVISLQNAWPVSVVCAWRSLSKQISGQLKQWDFGLRDSTVRRPVVWTATVSVFEWGANDLSLLRKAVLNWLAAFSSFMRKAARCSCGGQQSREDSIDWDIPQPNAASDSRFTESRLAIGNDMAVVKRKKGEEMKRTKLRGMSKLRLTKRY